MNTKKRFCFVNGEPYLYEIGSKEYTMLSYSYDVIVTEVISMIKEKNFKFRPRLNEILNMLAGEFEENLKYSPQFNINNKRSFESFESRFSRDVTAFFDQKFPRHLTDEEKRQKEQIKKKLKEEKEWGNYKFSCLRRR